MSDVCIRGVVEAIHSSPTRAVLYLSGGASQALGWLMSVPGASNTVLEAVVPYSSMSMIQLLGKVPAQFACRQTAEDMALMAYNRALKLSQSGCPVLGVGFTGSLASTRPKLGDHRFHLSTRTSDRLYVSTLTLSKGLRSREQEDRVSSQLLLKAQTEEFILEAEELLKLCETLTRVYVQRTGKQLSLLDTDLAAEVELAIANACKVPSNFASELTDSEVSEESEIQFDEDQELEQLINGQICFKVYPFLSDMSKAERKIILSGSFNPLHDGHLKLLEVALSILGNAYPCFELSAVNADKPPLTVSEIKERVRQFEKAGKTVIISNQPYFYKKAELFPGSAFVIGADTAARLINPKYYGGDYGRMLEILSVCKSTGCLFLVGGRNVDGVFKVLDDFDIPEQLRDMFISIPTDKFRMDISSTEIRKSQGML